MKLSLCAALAALFWLAGPAWADPGDERIVAARDAAARGDLPRLVALTANSSNHVLEPYVEYWALAARLARKTEAAPASAVSNFLSRNAGTWLAEKLRADWLRRLALEQRWDQFNSEYGLLMQPDQELRCLAIQAGGSYAEDASKALESVWLSMMDTPDACDIPLAALVTRGRVGTEEVWRRFRRLVEAKRFTTARETLAWLPEEQTPNPANLKLAMENPSRFLASAAAQAPASRAGREAVLAAIARLARSDVREAAARWRAIESNAFREEERAYAWGQLAWLAAQGHLPEAVEWFGQVRSSWMSEEQRAWRVRASLRAEDWPGVRQAIEAMPAEQRELPEWSYWLGRSLRQQGRAQEAQLQFQRYAGAPSFYGILSSEALGQTYGWPPVAQPATVQELGRAQATADFRRAEALSRLEMRTEAAREWNWGLRGADDRFLLAAAEYARTIGLYDRAINTAERTREQHDFSLRYLAPYYEEFSSQAKAQSLELSWVYGLVRQESRFLSVARSGVGAQGLMQVMPATGRWIARLQGWRDYDPSWLTRIDKNVQLGTAYLRHVLDSLNNHPVLASAAYNAGPGRARRWRDSKPMEGAIYAETIPFSETRDYVKKVMANTEMYATLFERRPVSLLARLGKVPAAGNDAPLFVDEP